MLREARCRTRPNEIPTFLEPEELCEWGNRCWCGYFAHSIGFSGNRQIFRQASCRAESRARFLRDIRPWLHSKHIGSNSTLSVCDSIPRMPNSDTSSGVTGWRCHFNSTKTTKWSLNCFRIESRRTFTWTTMDLRRRRPPRRVNFSHWTNNAARLIFQGLTSLWSSGPGMAWLNWKWRWLEERDAILVRHCELRAEKNSLRHRISDLACGYACAYLNGGWGWNQSLIVRWMIIGLRSDEFDWRSLSTKIAKISNTLLQLDGFS